jgi:hypothetical protein
MEPDIYRVDFPEAGVWIAVPAQRSGVKVLDEFDPSFELRVHFTQLDLDRAVDAKARLKLAFWDGQRWAVFDEVKHEFELRLDPKPDTGGVGIARIARWTDPAVGWGH